MMKRILFASLLFAVVGLVPAAAAPTYFWSGDIGYFGDYTYPDGEVVPTFLNASFSFLDPVKESFPTSIPNAAFTYCHPSGALGCQRIDFHPDFAAGTLGIDFWIYETSPTDLFEYSWLVSRITDFQNISLNQGFPGPGPELLTRMFEPQTDPSQASPEPAGLALLGLTAIGAGLTRRHLEGKG